MTGDTPRRKKQHTAATLRDPGRNDETAAALITADIPWIVAEVIRNVSNTGEDKDDNEDPPTQDEYGSSDEDEGIYHIAFVGAARLIIVAAILYVVLCYYTVASRHYLHWVAGLFFISICIVCDSCYFACILLQGVTIRVVYC